MLNYINWTIDPAIISEPIEIRYYGLFFAIAFYMGNLIIDRIFKAENIDPKWLDKLLIYVIIATIVGARLGHVFFYDWDDYKNNLQEIFMIWHGGLASHGAAVGIILAAWLFSIRVSKKSVLWILDRIVLTIALAAFLIRLGNFFNHEIVGIETNVPWAVIFHGHPDFTNPDLLPRHPTQLYEAICYLAFFIVLFRLFWKTNIKKQQGKLFGLFLILVFTARFVLEFYKTGQSSFDDTATIKTGQLLSIPFVIVGLYFYFKPKKETA
jgi:phosphatidylglycerol---prolipoprotein diacylglyceryl transferase